MLKRNISLLLALLMIAALLASCGGGQEAQTSTTTPVVQTAAETEPETDSLEARAKVSDDLGDKDFKGDSYRMLYQKRWSQYQYAEEMTGETLTDEVFSRNARVEERFNVKLVHIIDEEENLARHVTNSVLAGDDESNLYMGHAIYTGKYATQGIFRNWYELNVDFTKPWFPQYAIKNLTLNGRMFLTVSDICLSLAANTYCFYFNKEMANSAGMEDFYQVVRDGRWTVDYLLQNVATYYVDANGDGAYGDEDIYGFAGEKSNSTVAYLYSFQIDVLTVKPDGTLDMILGKDQRSNDAVEKLKKLLYGIEGSYQGSATAANLFKTQNAIFTPTTLTAAVGGFREDCDFDYGIIPYPKYEESQEQYLTVAGGGLSCCAIPITAVRDDIVATMFTVLSAESWKNVLPAFINVTVKYKGARDEASIEMIDLMLDGRNINFEFMYDAFTGYVYKVRTMLNSEISLATFAAENDGPVRAHYEKVLELFYPKK